MGRFFVVPLENVFNAEYTPIQRYGKPFFEGWDEEEWNRFYNFIFECAAFYLQHGLVSFDDNSLKRKIILSGINETVLNFFEDWVQKNREILNGLTPIKRHDVWMDYDIHTHNQWGHDIKGRIFSEKKFQLLFTKYFAGGIKQQHKRDGNVTYIDYSQCKLLAEEKGESDDELQSAEDSPQAPF